MAKQPLGVRFWSKVDRSGGEQSCWPWQAAKNPAGYGVFGLGTGITCLAHRVAWFLKKGEWPSENLLHRCDNPACCNHAHLF